MKKLFILLSCAVLSISASAQFPFAMSGNFLNLSVDTKASFGIAYNLTTAKVHIKGSGTSSATNAFYVEDNSSNLRFQLRDDGLTTIRTSTDNRYNFNGSVLSFVNDIGTIRNQTIQSSTITWDFSRFTTSNSTLVPSSALTSYWMQINTTGSDATFTGSNTLRVLDLKPTWNLVNGSTCDVVGIDYNPTVTLVNAPGIHYGLLVRSGRVGIGTATPKSSFETTGSTAQKINTITTTTTLDDSYCTVLANTSGGNITINLPDVNTCGKRVYYILKIDGANTLTIDPNGAQLINGSSTLTRTVAYSGYVIQTDGSAWYTISAW